MLYSIILSIYALRVNLLISLYYIVLNTELEAKFNYFISIIFRAYNNYYNNILLISSP